MRTNLARVESLEKLVAQRAAAEKAVEDARKHDPARKAAEDLAQLEADIMAAQEQDRRERLEALQAEIDELRRTMGKRVPELITQLEVVQAELLGYSHRWRAVVGRHEAAQLDRHCEAVVWGDMLLHGLAAVLEKQRLYVRFGKIAQPVAEAKRR